MAASEDQLYDIPFLLSSLPLQTPPFQRRDASLQVEAGDLPIFCASPTHAIWLVGGSPIPNSDNRGLIQHETEIWVAYSPFEHQPHAVPTCRGRRHVRLTFKWQIHYSTISLACLPLAWAGNMRGRPLSSKFTTYRSALMVPTQGLHPLLKCSTNTPHWGEGRTWQSCSQGLPPVPGNFPSLNWQPNATNRYFMFITKKNFIICSVFIMQIE